MIMLASDIRVIGGSIGPDPNANHPQIKTYNPGNTTPPTDIVVDGVRFHDFKRTNSTQHTECLQVYAGLRVTIRNSTFSNCDGTADLTISASESDAGNRDMVVENNFFDKTGDAPASLQISTMVQNLLFQYNSGSKEIIVNACSGCTKGPLTFRGNVFPYGWSLCTAPSTFIRNVWRGGTCSSSDLNASNLGFVNEATFNLHLAAGSPAINRGDPASSPSTDIDGQARPLGGTADAGADEAA